VEGIGVLHDELSAAEEACSWAGFVAELGLDLVEVEGELFVAGEAGFHEVGDDFFVGWAQGGGSAVAVGELEEEVAVVLVAFGVFVEFHWHEGGHEHFGCTGGVEFFADDGGDFLE